jgi:tRNA nucleotidyltransferase/poly(A) polymerase
MAAPRQNEMKDNAAVVATTTLGERPLGDSSGRLAFEDMPCTYSTIRTVAITGLKDYATFINRRLREHGYEAYLVGGCVRDILLHLDPKDFDIATSASPEGILRLFPGSGQVGAHFGVVLVREGPWQVEVATFRTDGDYSDGRRPDSIQFVSDPRHDVERRDFTINGLLLDPDSGEILDFVGGKADLGHRIIRAIGDPVRRFQEDHLRLLRAVRFAARLGFTIEPHTFTAIRELAQLVSLVAKERVRDEIHRIFSEGGAVVGLELLRNTQLDAVLGIPVTDRVIRRFQTGPFQTIALAWAALLADCDLDRAMTILTGFRLPLADCHRTLDLLRDRQRLQAPFRDQAELKRFLRQAKFAEQLQLHQLDGGEAPHFPDFSPEELWPEPLLKGSDLLAMGYPQGPIIGEILRVLEEQQLNGQLKDQEAAIQWLRRSFTTHSGQDKATAG